MNPQTFYDCTYNDVMEYVKYNSLQREKELKNQISIYEAVTDKMISATKWKNPRYISLIRDTFEEFFASELELKEEQTIEEQIRILRSMK